jgi:hypothetical protein
MPADLQAEYLVAEHQFMTEWSAKCGFTYAPATHEAEASAAGQAPRSSDGRAVAGPGS